MTAVGIHIQLMRQLTPSFPEDTIIAAIANHGRNHIDLSP